jgi:hypothetical protein
VSSADARFADDEQASARSAGGLGDERVDPAEFGASSDESQRRGGAVDRLDR